jgi:septum formation protein
VAYVTFSKLNDQEIEDYIQTREPYDKAGGYAIQGWAGKFISRIEGDYYNIVGLPINKLYSKLKRMERL